MNEPEKDNKELTRNRVSREEGGDEVELRAGWASK